MTHKLALKHIKMLRYFIRHYIGRFHFVRRRARWIKEPNNVFVSIKRISYNFSYHGFLPFGIHVMYGAYINAKAVP